MRDNHNISALGETGVYVLPYPAGVRERVQEAVTAWKDFCSLPEKIRTKFPYYSQEGMGVGYELKKVPGATLDLKEDFHYTLAAHDRLAEQARALNVPEITSLVEKLNRLFSGLFIPVMGVSRDVEESYSIPGFGKEINENIPGWYIRCLHYFEGSRVGEEIAKAHADKSGFTLHLYESDPGLQYLDRGYEWKDVLIDEAETVVLPGMRGQYRSRNKLKATYHRVVATAETADKGRFSVVAFIHPDKRTPQYDKAGKGRLQEFKPGFNYEMSFEEFSQLFTE